MVCRLTLSLLAGMSVVGMLDCSQGMPGSAALIKVAPTASTSTLGASRPRSDIGRAADGSRLAQGKRKAR